MIVFVLFFTTKTSAQVKIGGTPGLPHPSAVLQLDDTARGLLLPSLSISQRGNIASPQNGLLLYNNSTGQFNLYQQNSWQNINTDSSEWKYDPVSGKVQLTRSYQVGDTVFYDPLQHKFLFADKAIYTNSQNLNINPLLFGGKTTFKATASKNADSARAAGYAVTSIMEIDNASDSFISRYGSLNLITTINPSARQKPFFVDGLTNSTLHAGQDTVFILTGIQNTAYNGGIGFTETLYGMFNQVRMGNNSTGNLGSVYGIYNQMIRFSTASGRIQGNLYGQFNFITSSITSRVDGTAYGLFMTGITGAAQGNYAIYTNQGRNRFGDSVLVSNIASVPRAFFDINNNTAMIIPTGVSSTRPVTGVTGMMRYNQDFGGVLETYNGGQWTGTLRNTATIDVPSLPAGGTYTESVFVSGASLGSSVSVSPRNAFPGTLTIAYARVSAVNTVEIRFVLPAGATVDPPADFYYIRVFQ